MHLPLNIFAGGQLPPLLRRPVKYYINNNNKY